MKNLVLFLSFTFLTTTTWAQNSKLTVVGAASLSNVLNEVAKSYQSSKITFSFDASSKLAKQIEAGAPADIFFAADEEWVKYLEKKNRLLKDSKTDLLSNNIVLIVPTISKKIPASPADLKDNFYHHIALAGESVPAGKFGREALRNENAFDESVQKKVVNADNVRVALSWVASHEASAGIVYATDVLIEPKVKVAYTFQEKSHAKIIYSVAVIAGSKNVIEAKKFLEFCKGKIAAEIFRKAGFKFLL